MPAGLRINPVYRADPIPAYILPGGDMFTSPTGCGQHVSNEDCLALLNETRAEYARRSQDEHNLKKTGGEPRWHKAEARRYERLERAYRLVIAWLSGDVRDLQAHRFPLEMAEEIDAAFRHNSILMDKA